LYRDRLVSALRATGFAAAFLMGTTACRRADSSGPADHSVERRATDGSGIESVQTPADRLSNGQIRHTELVRIARNFGKSHFQIALDAWTSTGDPPEITDVRLWWARTDRDGERSPFSAKSRTHIDVEYERLSAQQWSVDIRSKGVRFRFSVELDETGLPAAFADIQRHDGSVLLHCRVRHGKIAARKFLGAPVGIDRFEVVCVDDEGAEHEGRMTEFED
jgi:hypothetical protein